MNENPLHRARDLVVEDLAVVDELMAESLHSRAEPIQRASEHLLLSGGKRIRALLCVLVGRATGVLPEKAQIAACGAELIHAASLCHDDVLDRGSLRRGRPTVRAIFGDALSILLGDFCLTRALRLMADRGLMNEGVALADAVVEMAEGEVEQALQVCEAGIVVEDYLRVAAGKTGSLLRWCTTLGGLAPARYENDLEVFGEIFGRVYQIADDLLDFEEYEHSGKRQGQDLLAGECTLPLLMALESRPDLRPRLVALRETKDQSPEIVQGIVADVRATGALEKARGVALGQANDAVEVLSSLPDSPHRDALGELARFAADRRV